MKWKKKLLDTKKGIDEKIGELDLQQKTLAFTIAWEGSPVDNPMVNKLGLRSPGKIYGRMNANMNALIGLYEKKEIDKFIFQAVRREVIGNFYDTSWKARGKGLTPQQREEYKKFAGDLEGVLAFAEAGTFTKSGKEILELVAKDIEDSEVREKNKLMEDFGLKRYPLLGE